MEMIYKLNKEQINKAKEAIIRLEENHTMWIIVKEKAQKELEKAAVKYHKNIKLRIKETQKEIESIEIKLLEFYEAIETKQVEIK